MPHLVNQEVNMETKKSGIINKEKMRGIDWQIYEKLDDGVHVKLVGTKTYRQIFDELRDHLKAVGFLEDFSFALSGRISDPDKQIPLNTYGFHAAADWGGSEGIDVNIGLTVGNKQFAFATGKTLSEDIESYLKMSRIAAECQLMLNGGVMSIPEDTKSRLFPAETAGCITRVINGEEHIIRLTEEELNRIWDEGDMLNTVNDVVHRLGEREDFAETADRITSEKADVIREIAEKFRNDRGMGSSYWYEVDEYIDERKNDLTQAADKAAEPDDEDCSPEM